jgi:hypothetical protein
VDEKNRAQDYQKERNSEVEKRRAEESLSQEECILGEGHLGEYHN